jgi:hypothetical protein
MQHELENAETDAQWLRSLGPQMIDGEDLNRLNRIADRIEGKLVPEEINA